MGKWFKIIICRRCKTKLSHEETYTLGICFNCGHEDSSPFNMAHQTIVIRRISHWWKIWDRKYEGVDKASQDWLNKINS